MGKWRCWSYKVILTLTISRDFSLSERHCKAGDSAVEHACRPRTFQALAWILPTATYPPKGRRGASFKKRFYISSDPLLILEKSSLLSKEARKFYGHCRLFYSMHCLNSDLVKKLSDGLKNLILLPLSQMSHFLIELISLQFFALKKKSFFFKKNSILTFPIAKA